LRLSLAADSLDALSLCLTIKSNSTNDVLQSQFRPSLAMEHIERIIDLALPVDEFVKRFRTAASELASSVVGDDEKKTWYVKKRLRSPFFVY
jgi:hypothetical protein